MSTEKEESIKVIVEVHAKPGRRTELMNLLASTDRVYAHREELLAAPFRATVIR
jgi:hypothetical protein